MSTECTGIVAPLLMNSGVSVKQLMMTTDMAEFQDVSTRFGNNYRVQKMTELSKFTFVKCVLNRKLELHNQEETLGKEFIYKSQKLLLLLFVFSLKRGF